MADQRHTVALLLEGTYPYVSGGVSSWVHDIIRGLPELGFTLFHIAAREDVLLEKRYQLPDNVADLTVTYCAGAPTGTLDARAREKLEAEIREARRTADRAEPSRVLDALRSLHLSETAVDPAQDAEVIAGLATADLDIPSL